MEWGPRSSRVGFFCFHALGDTKQKKPTPLDRGPPLHVNRVLLSKGLMEMIHSIVSSIIALKTKLSFFRHPYFVQRKRLSIH